MTKKIAIVTGGNRGIGLNITKALIDEDYLVVIGARTKIEIEDKYKNSIIFHQADLTNELSHQELIKHSKKLDGELVLYINNIGLSEWKPIEEIDEIFLDKMISTNLLSAFWGCKAASKAMKKGSSIINISSIAGKRGSKNNSAYCASKFALNGLTQSLAKELGPNGIRVNALCPVLIKTDGLVEGLNSIHSPANGSIDEFLSDFTKSNSALGRLPSGLEVAKMCIALASNNASAVTGQCINVDCGVLPQ